LNGEVIPNASPPTEELQCSRLFTFTCSDLRDCNSQHCGLKSLDVTSAAVLTLSKENLINKRAVWKIISFVHTRQVFQSTSTPVRPQRSRLMTPGTQKGDFLIKKFNLFVTP